DAITFTAGVGENDVEVRADALADLEVYGIKIDPERNAVRSDEPREISTRNDYDLTTSAGDVVRNGQRWEVEEIDAEGNIRARRCDDTNATVTLPRAYLREHTQLGYASTGHSAQGATVAI